MRRRDDNPARIVGLQHADGIGADQHRLARNVTHDEAGALGDGWRRDRRHGCRAHALGAVPDALARRAAERGGGAIDVADDAVREHVVAVADVACPRIRGRRGQVDLVEKIQTDNAGVVLADAGIVHDHGTHRPLGRIEGVVAAAIGPGDDDMRAVLGADVRATGDRQDFYLFVCSAHRFSPVRDTLIRPNRHRFDACPLSKRAAAAAGLSFGCRQRHKDTPLRRCFLQYGFRALAPKWCLARSDRRTSRPAEMSRGRLSVDGHLGGRGAA